jgi:PilZ domain
MKAAVASPVEHRDESRVPASSLARVEPLQSIFSPSGAAMIEEVSSCGLRLRTEARLHPGEELIVKVAGEPYRLRARVLWVRVSPPFHKGGTKTWSAGCKLDSGSIGKAHVAMSVVQVRTPFPWHRLLVVAGAIGVLALLIYLYLYLATLLGMSAGSWTG